MEAIEEETVAGFPLRLHVPAAANKLRHSGLRNSARGDDGSGGGGGHRRDNDRGGSVEPSPRNLLQRSTQQFATLDALQQSLQTAGGRGNGGDGRGGDDRDGIGGDNGRSYVDRQMMAEARRLENERRLLGVLPHRARSPLSIHAAAATGATMPPPPLRTGRGTAGAHGNGNGNANANRNAKYNDDDDDDDDADWPYGTIGAAGSTRSLMSSRGSVRSTRSQSQRQQARGLRRGSPHHQMVNNPVGTPPRVRRKAREPLPPLERNAGMVQEIFKHYLDAFDRSFLASPKRQNLRRLGGDGRKQPLSSSGGGGGGGGSGGGTTKKTKKRGRGSMSAEQLRLFAVNFRIVPSLLSRGQMERWWQFMGEPPVLSLDMFTAFLRWTAKTAYNTPACPVTELRELALLQWLTGSPGYADLTLHGRSTVNLQRLQLKLDGLDLGDSPGTVDAGTDF